MRKILDSWIARGLALLLSASVAFAENDRVPFRQAELDQILAPVALYPDSLLSQMLMASTYPLEVVQASRWSRANPGFKGQDAVNAVERMDWDPSVKSLTAFPQILSMMDEKLDWTERLGEAFLAQREDVMNTVQVLRRRAEAAGNLRSNERMRVARQDDAIVIEQPTPEIVYVPYYDTRVVYGPWLWPAYPPVYWAPPPAYYAVPAYSPAFFWGSGIVIGAGFFFGHFDWPHRHVTVTRVHHVHHHGHSHHGHHGRPGHDRDHWKHDEAHRRGVPFRNADAHHRYEQSRQADARRDADRGEREQPGFRDGRFRTADARQNSLDERRRIAAGQPRVDGHDNGRNDGRRESLSDRGVTPGSSGNRSGFAAGRGNDREPAPVIAPRAPQPQTRDSRPIERNDDGPGSRTGRPAPRAEERDAARPQPRNIEPRRTADTPATRPAVVTQPRPVAPAVQQQAAPRRFPEPVRQAETRGGSNVHRLVPQQRPAVREQAPAPRAAVAPAPRAAAPAPRMNDRPRPADRAPRAASRDNGRRS